MMMKRLFFLAACSLLTMTGGFSQTKFGYINSQEILVLMPGMKDVETGLAEYQAELEAEFQKELADYQRIAKELNDLQTRNASEALIKLKQEELMKKQEYIQKLQQTFEDELLQKQDLLMKPLLLDMQKAVNDIAKEKQLNYVFDMSQGMLLFVTETDDISKEVKTRLGIKE